MPTAYLSLGSNLGERLTHLRRALMRLDESSELRVSSVSPVYASEAHVRKPEEALPEFLNLVAGVETALAPDALLDRCLEVEAAGGRYREHGTWLPRTIDIDILVFANLVLDTIRLQLPHPRMAARRFVLLPLHDLDSGLWIPEPFGATVSALLSACTDQSSIVRLFSPETVFQEGSRAL